jgi:hypothetical protein
MNYKVMKRPMFRLGGDVRKNYQTGTSLEDLIKQRGELRQKRFETQRSLLPFSVLASEMPNIRTIRKPGDVLNILSNIGGSNELIGALAKLPSLDLKKSEGDLTDKIALEKIKLQRNKKTATELKLNAAEDAAKILAKYGSVKQIPAQERTKFYDLRKIAVGDLTPGTAIRLATLEIEDQESKKGITEPKLSPEEKRIAIQDLAKNFLMNQSSIFDREMDAEGGRVGYQDGTPEPMMQETISVEETLNPVKQQPQENAMSVKQMYDLMRQRIPVANVSDKDLYKIASSQQIMADFASLETMSDVTQFNEQYDTNIVLDLPIVG